MLILLYMAFLLWERAQLDKAIAATSGIEDPIALDPKGRPMINALTNTAIRRPADEKVRLAEAEAAHARRARFSVRALVSAALVGCLLHAWSLGASAEKAASSEALAECAALLEDSALQACLAPSHASYIGAAGDGASLEALTWAVLIL